MKYPFQFSEGHCWECNAPLVDPLAIQCAACEAKQNCPECAGLGLVGAGEDCARCYGTGEREKPNILQQLKDDIDWYAFARVPDGWVVVCMLQWYANTPEVWEVSRAHARHEAIESGGDPDSVIWVRADELNADQHMVVNSYWHGYLGLPRKPQH